uniref:Uncharacterized protein n=2 Tax=Paracidobacterium acidisoli TaxID=2303751 RepID=A0A372IS27_9BACT
MPSNGGTVRTYQGVSNMIQATYGALGSVPSWSLVLSSTESSFRHNDAYSSDVLPVTGTYSSDNGYLLLTSSGQPPAGEGQGYSLVLPGEAALLRPGDSTFAPVIAADMESCPAIKNNETFLFVALPGLFWNNATSAAYGTVQAATDTTGVSWSFSSQSQSLLTGSGSPPSYPTSFSGTCGQGINGYNIGYGISILPTAKTPYYSPTISVSPGGLFTESATGAAVTNINAPNNYPQQPLVGVAAPSSALDTNGLAAGKYLGFMYQSLPNSNSADQTQTTQLISFGTITPGAGTTMTGGVFPKDDPSQMPATNVVVNLGAQSASQNGLYTGVRVTMPDTSTVAGTCAKYGGSPGMTAGGSLTCSFPAVAVAGNPDNKFVIFLIGQNPIQQAPFGLYLYQQ